MPLLDPALPKPPHGMLLGLLRRLADRPQELRVHAKQQWLHARANQSEPFGYVSDLLVQLSATRGARRQRFSPTLGLEHTSSSLAAAGQGSWTARLCREASLPGVLTVLKDGMRQMPLAENCETANLTARGAVWPTGELNWELQDGV
jgi:hypothetical protein